MSSCKTLRWFSLHAVSSFDFPPCSSLKSYGDSVLPLSTSSPIIISTLQKTAQLSSSSSNHLLYRLRLMSSSSGLISSNYHWGFLPQICTICFLGDRSIIRLSWSLWIDRRRDLKYEETGRDCVDVGYDGVDEGRYDFHFFVLSVILFVEAPILGLFLHPFS
jgi:hypothetical protein